MIIGFQQVEASSTVEKEIDRAYFPSERRRLVVGMGCALFPVINGGVGAPDYNWFRIYHNDREATVDRGGGHAAEAGLRDEPVDQVEPHCPPPAGVARG